MRTDVRELVKLRPRRAKAPLTGEAKAGLAVVAAALVAQLAHTWWFGWNWTAQSDAEWWADLICQHTALAGLIMALQVRLKRKGGGGRG